MAASRIAELSSIIKENTSLVDDYFASRGLPSISFDPDAAPGLQSDPAIRQHRQAIIAATDELHALMQGPMKFISSHLVSS